MDAQTLLDRVEARYDGLVAYDSWGERALFYNPGRDLPRGAYFLTVKIHDSEHDRASNLDRPERYRMSIQLSKQSYCEQFGTPPKRPPKGGVVDTGHDFTETDTLLPHPVYAWAGWACLLSPTEESLATLWPLLDEAYERAVARYEQRRAELNETTDAVA